MVYLMLCDVLRDLAEQNPDDETLRDMMRNCRIVGIDPAYFSIDRVQLEYVDGVRKRRQVMVLDVDATWLDLIRDWLKYLMDVVKLR